MSLSQSLPITYTATLTAATRAGGSRTVSGLLLHAFSRVRSLVRTATDNSRLSPGTLRDIGLVRGEPPYVGAWDQCWTDYRL